MRYSDPWPDEKAGNSRANRRAREEWPVRETTVRDCEARRQVA